jgi:hypothetical protein
MTDAQEVNGRVVDVAPAQARALAGHGALLRDVGEDDEWAAGHIAGSVHLPLGQLDPHPGPRSSCRGAVPFRQQVWQGRASAGLHRADQRAQPRRGILAWAKSGLPLVTPTEASSEDR